MLWIIAIVALVSVVAIAAFLLHDELGLLTVLSDGNPFPGQPDR